MSLLCHILLSQQIRGLSVILSLFACMFVLHSAHLRAQPNTDSDNDFTSRADFAAAATEATRRTLTEATRNFTRRPHFLIDRPILLPNKTGERRAISPYETMYRGVHLPGGGAVFLIGEHERLNLGATPNEAILTRIDEMLESSPSENIYSTKVREQGCQGQIEHVGNFLVPNYLQGPEGHLDLSEVQTDYKLLTAYRCQGSVFVFEKITSDLIWQGVPAARQSPQSTAITMRGLQSGANISSSTVPHDMWFKPSTASVVANSSSILGVPVHSAPVRDQVCAFTLEPPEEWLGYPRVYAEEHGENSERVKTQDACTSTAPAGFQLTRLPDILYTSIYARLADYGHLMSHDEGFGAKYFVVQPNKGLITTKVRSRSNCFGGAVGIYLKHENYICIRADRDIWLTSSHEYGHYAADLLGWAYNGTGLHPCSWWSGYEGAADAFALIAEHYRNAGFQPEINRSSIFANGPGSGFQRNGLLANALSLNEVRKKLYCKCPGTLFGLCGTTPPRAYYKGFAISQIIWRLINNRMCDWVEHGVGHVCTVNDLSVIARDEDGYPADYQMTFWVKNAFFATLVSKPDNLYDFLQRMRDVLQSYVSRDASTESKILVDRAFSFNDAHVGSFRRTCSGPWETENSDGTRSVCSLCEGRLDPVPKRSCVALPCHASLTNCDGALTCGKCPSTTHSGDILVPLFLDGLRTIVPVKK